MNREIFDQKILCQKCDKIMIKTEVSKNRFILRAIECPKCKDRILHPIDEQEYSKFIKLKIIEYK